MRPPLFPASNHAVVLLEGIQSNHLFYRVTSLLQNLGLLAKNGIWISSYVNAACFDRHEELIAWIEKRVKVFGQYSCLVWLCDVAIHGVNFGNEGAVSTGKASILKDWYGVDPVFGHVVN